MVKSIDKGKGYELGISKLLTKWAGFKIIRTPQSGAWQGTSGDIIPENRERQFPLIIECKKEESWNYESVMVGKNKKFRNWLKQLRREVQQDFDITGIWRFPILIFSRNFKPDFICHPVIESFEATGLSNYSIVEYYGIRHIIVDLLEYVETIPYNELEIYGGHYMSHASIVTRYLDLTPSDKK